MKKMIVSEKQHRVTHRQTVRHSVLLKFFPALLFLLAIPVKAKAFAFIPILGYLAVTTAIGYFVAPAATSWVLGNAADGVIRLIGWAILGLVLRLLDIAQFLFNAALIESTDFSTKLPVIEAGWKVARDATNIFFIIILLIMSIGTILRLQNYNAKRLLVNLVLMAILINFSLAIGSVVVDFSNVLGFQFLTAIHPEGKVSDVIAQSLHITDVFKQPEVKGTDQYLIATLGNALLLSVLIFVFFVSGLLMFVRMAMIILLLAVAPIAFLLYILPETQRHFSDWWSKLIQYSFFFPAFMFLLYVSMTFITTMNKQLIGAGVAEIDINFLNNKNLIVAYFIAIVLLIASLLMGQRMGISGANAVIGWAKTGRKYVTGALASGALYPARLVARGVAESDTVQRLKDRLQESRFIPKGLGAAASRGIDAMLQRGAVMGQMRPKSAEQTADFLAKQDNDSILKAWGGLSYMQKMAVLRKLPKDRRDKLMELLPEDQKQLALRMTRGFEGEGREGELAAAEWQRRKGIDAEDGMRYFAQMSRAGKERALRTMDQKEQADYREKLGQSSDPNLRKAAGDVDDIIRTEFTQQQRTAFRVAQANKMDMAGQLAWLSDSKTTNQERAMFLAGKSPEDQENYVDQLEQQGGGVDVVARKAMDEYFTPEQLQKRDITNYHRITAPALKAAAWQQLSQKAKEDVVRGIDTKQRLDLLNNLRSQGLTADYYAASDIMLSVLSPKDVAQVGALQHIKKTPAQRQAELDTFNDLHIEETLNLLKTPEEQWDYINSLTPAQQRRVRDVMSKTLSGDAKDDFAAYGWANRASADENERINDFTKLTVRQRVKALRNMRGKTRGNRLKELFKTPDGRIAVGEARDVITQRERDTMAQEMCDTFADDYKNP